MPRHAKTHGLELHRSGYWGVRYRDPYLTHPDGRPKHPFKLLREENGERVSSKARAADLAQAFLATLPPPPTRSQASVAPIAGMSIARVAELWHAGNTANRTRDDTKADALKLAGILAVDYPSEITEDKIKTWHRTHNRTGLRKGANLRSILAWGIAEKHLPALRPEVMDLLSAPQSKRKRVPLIGVPEWEQVMAVAETHGHLPLFHCLSLYGWRPVTACRLRVRDVDLRRAKVTLDVKRMPGDDEPHIHTLTPQTCALLEPLIAGRGADEAVFVTEHRGGRIGPWRIDKGTKANQLSQWYRDWCQHLAPECSGVYALKRFAIWRMRMVLWPWCDTVDRMDDAMIVQFTGHRTEEMVALYRKTSDDEMYRAVGQLGADGKDPGDLLRASRFGGGGEFAVAKKSAARFGGDQVVIQFPDMTPDATARY